MPGTVLGPGATGVNKTDMVTALWSLEFGSGEQGGVQVQLQFWRLWRRGSLTTILETMEERKDEEASLVWE